MGVRRYSPQEGPRIFPGSGSWLEQDAELMLALELLDDINAEEEQVERQMRMTSAEIQKLRNQLLAR